MSMDILQGFVRSGQSLHESKFQRKLKQELCNTV